MNNNSDCSLMDTSMQDTSLLPGSFPSMNALKQPQQENPPLILDEDLSFIPYQQQGTPKGNDKLKYSQNYILPRSPVFSFKSRKLKYPDFLNTDVRNKENGDDGIKFNFESDILTKKYSQRLSNKVLQELDSRMNGAGVDTIKRNLFSPRSQIRKQVRDKLMMMSSPRSQVHTGFNVVHNKHFNKLESINNHYSVHGIAQQQHRDGGVKVMKKRRTLVGPEEIMEDIKQHSESLHHSKEQSFKAPTLDPRKLPLDTGSTRRIWERKYKEPRVSTAEPRKTLDPKSSLRRLPSSRELSREISSRKTAPPQQQQQQPPQQQQAKTSSIPVLNKKSSFLMPTASSLSKSTSTYDLHHRKEQIRKSSSTMFTNNNNNNNKPDQIKRSTTTSNLQNRVSHSRTMHNLSSASSIVSRISGSQSHYNLHRLANTPETSRPVWR